MSNDNVIKFGKAAKSLKRAEKKKKAAENRARHGLKKSEKQKRSDLTRKLQHTLDGHKLEEPPKILSEEEVEKLREEEE